MFVNLIAGVREYVGARKRILSALHRLEHQMASATEQLNTLSTKVDDLTSDVRAALTVINDDKLSDTAQAALDGILAKVEAFDAEVGDKDGSDGPTEELPTPDEPLPGV